MVNIIGSQGNDSIAINGGANFVDGQAFLGQVRIGEVAPIAA